MEGIRPDSNTARTLAQSLGSGGFRLIDVGCSGGLDLGWQVFGDRLSAFGFDIDTAEIERLNRAETRPGVRYISGAVDVPDGHPQKDAYKDRWRANPWRRITAHRTVQLQQARAAGLAPPPRHRVEPFAPLPPAGPRPGVTTTAEAVHLPDFLEAQGISDVDFIKIDVDGPDFEILQTLEHQLTDHRVLGVCIEVGYSGVGGDDDGNSFHLVDRFLRRAGFDLMDLSVRRYSLAALPFPFIFPYPAAAQTTRGRPLIGDALYMRDFGHACRLDPAGWSDDKLIKLAALFCLFGLPDHAAELLLTFEERLAARLDIPSLLDELTAEIQSLADSPPEGFTPFRTYDAYVAAYEADAPYFYGPDARVQTQTSVEAALAKARAAAAEQEAMTRTLSWRITAPLRRLRRLWAPPRSA